MRTLKQITDAVRRNEGATYREIFYTVVAYDVLLAQMNIAADQQQVAEFFKAAESCPKEYAGPDNDPEKYEAVEWHRTHINNRPEVFERAGELIAQDDSDDPFGTREPIVPTGPHCPKCGKQEAAGNYSLELMSPEQQAVAPLWECMACHHAWGHGDGADPLTVVTPGSIASVQIEGRVVFDTDEADFEIRALMSLDWFDEVTVHKTAADINQLNEAVLDEGARELMSLDWSTPDHEKTHKFDVVRPEPPVTICITCTRIHTGDDCPFCADKMPYLDEVPFVVLCYADRDGDCSHEGCPQLRDGEPLKTGRHCPLDTGDRR